MSGGVKFDGDKPDYSLLNLWAMAGPVRVLMFGARKYPERMNWQKVRPPRRYFAAAVRHLADYQNGERNDPESGESHISHAICDLIFAAWFERMGLLGPESFNEPEQPLQPVQLPSQQAPSVQSPASDQSLSKAPVSVSTTQLEGLPPVYAARHLTLIQDLLAAWYSAAPDSQSIAAAALTHALKNPPHPLSEEVPGEDTARPPPRKLE